MNFSKGSAKIAMSRMVTDLKNKLAISLVLLIIIAVSCIIIIWKLQPLGYAANTHDSTTSKQVSSNTGGTWHNVITFVGVGYMQTDPFHIEGDKFRVKYSATPVNDSDARSFIVVQAKSQLEDNGFLYGHINDILDTVISDILEVNQGSGLYHLLIWDEFCANWQIEVESYH
ncbi:MAG: hypothetical protein HN929_06155 [Chloroflexi bacterium]|jgi:hypothetical protein|nr:hypothetical protein [Chloroflexota bacterium]MBT7081032.1 hypothetical protein [Chloroflexota bacterium]MBT7289205.1 hypothetical protein [Chloroflexota bacterium]